MIRINERSWIEEILSTHEKPNKMTYYQLERYIAMYYFDEWHELKNSQYARNVLDVMKEFHFSFTDYQEWKHVDYVKRFCKKLVNDKARHTLLEIKSVSLTRKEIEIIRSAETEKQQQLMFTFYVFAKINLMPTGWINYDLKDVFECADLKMTKQNRHRFIYGLYKQGLIRLNEYPDKRGYMVQLQDDINDIAMTITCFEHLGRQYLDKYKDGWMMCKGCGKMIKIKAPNQKYCKKCAANEQKKQIKIWKQENSEKSLQTAPALS